MLFNPVIQFFSCFRIRIQGKPSPELNQSIKLFSICLNKLISKYLRDTDIDVLAVPDNGDKIRSCAFTPVAVLNEDAEWADDPEVHKRIDGCYDVAIDRLETLLEQADFEDFKKHEVLSNEWNLAVGFETVLKILN